MQMNKPLLWPYTKFDVRTPWNHSVLIKGLLLLKATFVSDIFKTIVRLFSCSCLDLNFHGYERRVCLYLSTKPFTVYRMSQTIVAFSGLQDIVLSTKRNVNHLIVPSSYKSSYLQMRLKSQLNNAVICLPDFGNSVPSLTVEPFRASARRVG